MSGRDDPSHQLSDEELVQVFQNGREDAFNILVGRYKDPLVNFACRFFGNLAEAEDVVQETFVRFYLNKESYRPIAKFSTWIYTIAANLARTRLRQIKRARLLSLFPGRNEEKDTGVVDLRDDGPGPDIATERSMERELLERAIQSLPEKFREVVILSDVQDLSHEEICRITGLASGTLKSRLNRARARMRRFLEGKIDG